MTSLSMRLLEKQFAMEKRDESLTFNRLPLLQKIAYSVGHGLNDLIIGFGWSYIVLYAQIGLKLEVVYSGYIIFAAQIADFITEPLTGIFSDRWDGCCHLGKRKSWFVFGSAMQIAMFVLLFCFQLGLDDQPDSTRIFYYIPIMAALSVGSGIVFVSHVSILPEISRSPLERIQLHGWRNAMTVACNVTVYVAGLVILFIDRGSNGDPKLSQDDGHILRTLAIFCVSLGTIYVTIFTAVVKEKRSEEDFVASNNLEEKNCQCTKYTEQYLNLGFEGEQKCEKAHKDKTETIANGKDKVAAVVAGTTKGRVSASTNKFSGAKTNSTIEHTEWNVAEFERTGEVNIGRKNFLKTVLMEYKFYLVTVIFSCTRLAVTMSQLYMPLYSTSTLDMDKISIAAMPLIVYTSGFIASLLMKKVNKRLGRRTTLALGEIVIVGSCLWIFFITKDVYQQIYGASIVLGAGLATSQVTAMAMVTDLIGQNTEYGASVFGIIGGVEKISQGVVAVLLQYNNPCGDTVSNSCLMFYKNIMVAVPGAATLVAFLSMLVGALLEKRKKNRSKLIKMKSRTKLRKLKSGGPTQKKTAHREIKT